MVATKGKSPFYPGQPIPPELFTGRDTQIRRIKARGVDQVAAGKPVSMYIQGEYGIGKSSIANYIRAYAERDCHLQGVYLALGRAQGLTDVAAAVLEGILGADADSGSRVEAVRAWLKKYVKEVKLFGFTPNLDAIKKDAADFASARGILGLLAETIRRLAPEGVAGIVLILDEINGIAGNPLFAHLIKDLVETNAAARNPLPLLLLICGTEEKRHELIHHHPPVGRICDVVQVGPMEPKETRQFFRQAFRSVGVTVDEAALDEWVYYSGGLPKIMHEIGNAAYYLTDADRIDKLTALEAVEEAADEVGKKYVEPEVVKAIRSKTFQAILEKLAALDADEFTRDELAATLADEEKGTLDNFLQRMKRLHVLRSGESLGEYTFNIRLYQVYLTMKLRRPPRREDGPRHG
jgi:hypothetical protein